MVSGGFEDLAAEYYDPVRHATCANFREASDRLLEEWLEKHPVENSWICEVGPGRSVVGEQLARRKIALSRVILVDSSRGMLAHSKQWAAHGAHLALGDSSMLPLASASMDLVVSALGDPYNVRPFWRELYRVLRRGGWSFFTTPAHDWAVAFRRGSDPTAMTSAEFELSDGRRIRVASLIYPVLEQCRLVEGSGLEVCDVAHVRIRELTSPRLSPKLVAERGWEANIVTGYVVSKPAEEGRRE